MTKEEAKKLLNEAFRGFRYRLEKNGVLDLILDRASTIVVLAVEDEKKRQEAKQ